MRPGAGRATSPSTRRCRWCSWPMSSIHGGHASLRRRARRTFPARTFSTSGCVTVRITRPTSTSRHPAHLVRVEPWPQQHRVFSVAESTGGASRSTRRPPQRAIGRAISAWINRAVAVVANRASDSSRVRARPGQRRLTHAASGCDTSRFACGWIQAEIARPIALCGGRLVEPSAPVDSATENTAMLLCTVRPRTRCARMPRRGCRPGNSYRSRSRDGRECVERESAPRSASKRSVATVESSSLARTPAAASVEGDVARACAGAHHRSPPSPWAVCIETIDEHAIGAQVCGEREAVEGSGRIQWACGAA